LKGIEEDLIPYKSKSLSFLSNPRVGDETNKPLLILPHWPLLSKEIFFWISYTSAGCLKP
jgi:hypothetical protein